MVKEPINKKDYVQRYERVSLCRRHLQDCTVHNLLLCIIAELYKVETRALKQAVKRNSERFPPDFMFRLTKEEADAVLALGMSQNVIPPGYNVGATSPMAFCELCKPLHNTHYVNKKIM